MAKKTDNDYTKLNFCWWKLDLQSEKECPCNELSWTQFLTQQKLHYVNTGVYIFHFIIWKMNIGW